MTDRSEPFDEVQRVFEEVCARPIEDQERYLSECCSDPRVRQEVRKLLAHALPIPEPIPFIGRYRQIRELGSGGFGVVYLAHDDKLNRRVAIKVPRPDQAAQSGFADTYLTEARIVAALRHLNIVQIYDTGSTPQYPWYIVSEYMEGGDLARRIACNRLNQEEAVELVIALADALRCVHQKNIFHRDVKPANILLDRAGTPYLGDFGLALKAEDRGHGPPRIGTPNYMSPEQASGEGHRVNGRSDIFSLGVVFYELLTGYRPFNGNTVEEILDQIRLQEPTPLRQLGTSIPKELERICLKALEKLPRNRYGNAQELLDDLHDFKEQATAQKQASQARTQVTSPLPEAIESGVLGLVTPPSDQEPVKIIPKGLRSFEAADADFFLALLPGPRDRKGLPECIRFWKIRIEEKDADNTFKVGLISGQSGCGKSSLVKAGLLPLPQLATAHVLPVYVAATGEGTETRLLQELRSKCHELSPNVGLTETLKHLRLGRGLRPRQKVLIVLDQFEQWLHANQALEGAELLEALEQCDGGRVQCIILVREDFNMVAYRFMQALNLDLKSGENWYPMDLFDTRHAREVLERFGRATPASTFPESGKLSPEHITFLKKAVEELAQDGKVVPVHLALFAEMFKLKGKPWTLVTLNSVGGTAKVGEIFLKEMFDEKTAHPEQRLHRQAARAVLKSLLPEQGGDIKGNRRSHSELLAASGYANKQKEFSVLLRILNTDLRLITPIDRGDDGGSSGERYYQLTHDYLVPSLREWLDQGMKQTWHGRAIVRLQEMSRSWSRSKDHHFVPTLVEHAVIRTAMLRRWHAPSPEESALLRQARLRNGTQLALAAIAVFFLVVSWWYFVDEPRRRAMQIVTDLDKVGVNVQILYPEERENTGAHPKRWDGLKRARAANGYYRETTDNWGQGRFKKPSMMLVLEELNQLKEKLVWGDFTELESLNQPVSVSDFPDLEELEFDNCRNLPSLTLKNLPKLMDLRLSGCYRLDAIEGLGELRVLTALSLPEYKWNGEKLVRRSFKDPAFKGLDKLKTLKFLGWRDADSAALKELDNLPENIKKTLTAIDIGFHPAGIVSHRKEIEIADLNPFKALPELKGIDVARLTGREIPDFSPLKTLPELKRIYVAGLTEAELKRLAEQLGFDPKADVKGRPRWNIKNWGQTEKDHHDDNRPVYSILLKGDRPIELIHNEPTAARPPTSVPDWPDPLKDQP